jgi:hypothetical protein
MQVRVLLLQERNFLQDYCKLLLCVDCVVYVFNYTIILHRNMPSFEVEVTLQLTVCQSVCQGIEPTLRLLTRDYFLSEGCRLKVAVLSL